MSPHATYSNCVFRVLASGEVDHNSAINTNAIHPVVHLKSTINITGGTGSSTDPFILSEN